MFFKLAVLSALVAFLFYYITQQPVGLEATKELVQITGTNITLARNQDGVAHIFYNEEIGFIKGLGYVHARDRGLQLILTRIAGQGRLSELLEASEKTYKIDVFLRQRQFYRHAKESAKLLTQESRQFLEAYVQGINTYFSTHVRPLECFLIGYEPAKEPWTIEDSIMLLKLSSYLGLAQSQEDLEKFIIESIQMNDKALDVLRLAFAPHLDGLSQELIDVIRKVKVEQYYVPEALKSVKFIPELKASNNWVIGAKKSATGKPIYNSDPHLDISRLPSIFSEIVGKKINSDEFIAGIAIPGIPGVLMGRTKNIGYGFTYGFMDMVDFFIEDCNEQMQCKFGDEYEPVQVIEEVIQRKGNSPITTYLFRTRNGILELNNETSPTITKGLYLSRAYTMDTMGGHRSFEGIQKLFSVKTVHEAIPILHKLEISTNFILADTQDNIAYQQTGLLPNRQNSGLFPLLGWNKNQVWNGLVEPSKLKTIINPPEDYIGSCNDLWNPDNGIIAVNAHAGKYRKKRMIQLFEEKQKLGIEDMKRMQADLYSFEAFEFMKLLKPLLAKRSSPAAQALLNWDLRYNKESKAAPIFEQFWKNIMTNIFGPVWQEDKHWEFILRETPLFLDYAHYFNELILSNKITWLNVEQAIETALDSALNSSKLETWGQVNSIYFHHIFFKEVLPYSVSTALGMSYGPVPLEGGKATLNMGLLFPSLGDYTTFAVSYRMITDMGTRVVSSILPGGQSGDFWRRNLYMSDLNKFLNFEYKQLHE